jgi:hypothetical protein
MGRQLSDGSSRLPPLPRPHHHRRSSRRPLSHRRHQRFRRFLDRLHFIPHPRTRPPSSPLRHHLQVLRAHHPRSRKRAVRREPQSARRGTLRSVEEAPGRRNRREEATGRSRRRRSDRQVECGEATSDRGASEAKPPSRAVRNGRKRPVERTDSNAHAPERRTTGRSLENVARSIALALPVSGT